MGNRAIRRIWSAIRRWNWQHVLVELLIVVVGVFLGMQVSNWNDERREQRELAQLLEQLRPEVERVIDGNQNLVDYYTTTQNYAQTALAGWRGDASVSDEQFVIAAYQASQIIGSSVSSEVWATIFGSEMVPRIADPELRHALGSVLIFDTDSIGWAMLRTEYRADVRGILPEDIQAAIRDACGDNFGRDGDDATSFTYSRLPPACDLDLPDARFTEAARLLRANPQLPVELRRHLAEVSTFLTNVQISSRNMEALLEELQQL